MKFLCLTLCKGEVWTNADAGTNDDDDDAQRTKHDCIRLLG